MSVRTPSRFMAQGMWGKKYKENVLEVKRVFNKMDRNDLLNRRKILLVERENIFRELALIKFRKSLGSSSCLKKGQNSEDMEKILAERLQELTEKLKREFHLYPVEMKKEESSIQLKDCKKADPSFTRKRQDFTSFLVRGVSLHIPSHREKNVWRKTNDRNDQKKDKKESVARILPPLVLPSVHHCQRQRRLPAMRKIEQKTWRESEGTVSGCISREDLVDCRYLRVYMPKNKGK